MGCRRRVGLAAASSRLALVVFARQLRRYWIPDVAGWAAAVLAGLAAHTWIGRLDALAIGATLGENIGFYGAAAVLEFRSRRARGRPASPRDVARSLLLEFAPAELLDTVFVRPLTTAIAVQATASPVVGISVGGFVADTVFYTLAAACARAQSANGPRRAAPSGALESDVRDFRSSSRA